MPKHLKTAKIQNSDSSTSSQKRNLSVLSRSEHCTSSENESDPPKKFCPEQIDRVSRNSRRLRNIINTVDQPPKVELSAVAPTKRKVGRPRKDDSGEETISQTMIKCPKISGDDVDVIVEGEKKLRNALGKHYFEVGNRLGLEHVPDCLKNVRRCEEQHAQRSKQARKVNQRIQQDTKELLIENRPVHFLDYLEQALLRNEFIDSQLFVKALELVLTVNEPSDQLKVDYTVRSLLDQTADILDRTVDQFPPCWLDLKRAYQGIIFGNLEESCFIKYGRSEGLFKLIIFLLEQCVENEKERRSLKNQPRTKASSERSAANYYLWEQEHNQKFDYDLLERGDKLERLFLVLQILVKILESDLAMWIFRHPHKAKENMFHSNRRPLIASLLWHEYSTIGEVNSLIKRIIALYVNVSALRYPEETIKTLARLVSITGTTVNLTEFQYDGTIEYPCIKDNTRYFVQQIWRYAETFNYYSVSLCLRLIEQMRSPLLRMMLASDFLQKLTHQHGDGPSVVSYLKPLANGVWKEFRPDDPKEPVSSGDRFPYLNKRIPRKAAHDIGRPQFVGLLLIAFRAYMDVYPLKSYFQHLKPTTGSKTLRSSFPAGRKSALSKSNDFEAMERTIEKLAKRFTRLVTTVVRNPSDGPSSFSLVLEEINVTPALLLRYRDDVKHLLLIHRWLQTKTNANEDYRILFGPWKRYLATIDETLVCA